MINDNDQLLIILVIILTAIFVLVSSLYFITRLLIERYLKLKLRFFRRLGREDQGGEN